LPRDEVINGVNVHRFKSYISIGHYGLFPASSRRCAGTGLISFTRTGTANHKVKSEAASAPS
jgi:hypothetical protein